MGEGEGGGGGRGWMAGEGEGQSQGPRKCEPSTRPREHKIFLRALNGRGGGSRRVGGCGAARC